MFEIDPIHEDLQTLIEGSEIISDVWRRSYCRNEQHPNETFRRVANAISKRAPIGDDSHVIISNEIRLADQFYHAMKQGLWMPGGRILAGAGTQNRVTLMNCYVSPDIPDDMEGIADAHKVAMITQQQGGGIGMDFSTLRPSGAVLNRTGSVASGPIPFMDHWDAMCKTVRSAGDRRGAMMATICDTHPDLPAFIQAKHEKGRLRNFNVSVLVSDAFYNAVQDDADWELFFHVPPADPDKLKGTFVDDDEVTQYVYDVVRARDLWNLITSSTYMYSEPGIIFIDRINDLNNLRYAEYIHCTNPCGEQPLPPNGTCNLGAINLARLVREPFTRNAEVDFALLKQLARLGVDFLDNVIDITRYPTDEISGPHSGSQSAEEYNKRRLGLGISGLATAFAQMGMRYGGGQSVALAREIQKTICISAYERSIELAEEKGPFPLFDDAKFFQGFAGQKLPAELIDRIHSVGIRNALINTIAPTGTTSILFGYLPGGCEPVFLLEQDRKVRMGNKDDEWKEYKNVPDYTLQLYMKHFGLNSAPHKSDRPEYLVESDQITIDEHIRVQAALQEWVDASVSKTINCPEDISFEDFQDVYTLAFERGCKGCTTYRPSDVRGSILSDPNAGKRPDSIPGFTYKLNWPSWESALYLVINEWNGKPWEVFLFSKDARYQEWIVALSVLLSISMRRTDIDPMEIVAELKQIQSIHDSTFIGSKRYGSLIAFIAEKLEEHLAERHQGQPIEVKTVSDPCPVCVAPMERREGCKVCTSCGYTMCG